MATKQQDIRTLSEKHARLETLINHVNYETLYAEHRRQDRHKAVGVDRVTKEEYEKNLEENLKDLVKRMKSFSYRPQPVRRVEIPKANGKTRPLGIPSYEDKLVQGVMADILNDVYEPRFLDCSYGFRPGRKAHDAIKAVNDLIMFRKVNYILDCDIKGFFDNVDHKWLMKFLENDIADKNFLRYIVRFLKAGIMVGNRYEDSSVGTPQGGLISPVLANVYLHYVLDLWFEKCIKPQLKGEAYLVRYADDFIIMCQYENEAHAIFEALKERLAKFGLETADDKTKIMPFGRNSTTKDTFDFLGFTHVNSKTRKGKYTVGHKISKKKKKQFKANLKKWVKENRNMEFMTFMSKLNRKLIGTNNYYSVSGSILEVKGLYNHAFWVVYKWMNRRSQRKSFTYDKFSIVWKALIRRPYIHVNIWNAGGVVYN
jgi:group II intron reverse transcriptase/maturase